jgi:hypothetical protein
MKLARSHIVSTLSLCLLVACGGDDLVGGGPDAATAGASGASDAGNRGGAGSGATAGAAAAGQTGAAGGGGVSSSIADAGSSAAAGRAAAGAMGTAGSKGGEAGGTVDPPPPGCLDVPLTKDPVCQPTEQWRRTAAVVCAARMLPTSALRTSRPCEGGFEAGTATCCKPDVAPMPPPSCIDARAGSRDACRSAAEWKAYADRACRADDRTLTEVTPTDPDGCMDDAFHAASYRCCR